MTNQPVVAYRSHDHSGVLFCRVHGRTHDAWRNLTPLTSEELPDGGFCTWADCGVDVLIPPVPGQPEVIVSIARYTMSVLGPRLAAHLSTDAQRADALAVFAQIAEVEGPDVARAWLVGMNPLLDDRPPLTVIRDGGTAAVLAAATAYLT